MPHAIEEAVLTYHVGLTCRVPYAAALVPVVADAFRDIAHGTPKPKRACSACTTYALDMVSHGSVGYVCSCMECDHARDVHAWIADTRVFEVVPGLRTEELTITEFCATRIGFEGMDGILRFLAESERLGTRKIADCYKVLVAMGAMIALRASTFMQCHVVWPETTAAVARFYNTNNCVLAMYTHLTTGETTPISVKAMRDTLFVFGRDAPSMIAELRDDNTDYHYAAPPCEADGRMKTSVLGEQQPTLDGMRLSLHDIATAEAETRAVARSRALIKFCFKTAMYCNEYEDALRDLCSEMMAFVTDDE